MTIFQRSRTRYQKSVSRIDGQKEYYTVGWRYTILPFLEEQAIHDVWSKKWMWANDPSHRRTNPCIILVYHCPSTPGSPQIYNRTKVIWETAPDPSFDGFGARDQVAIGSIIVRESFPLAEYAEGAWFGTKRRPTNSPDLDLSMRQTAKLTYITDGLSKTILIGEQAGLPHVYEGPNIARLDAITGAAWIRIGYSAEGGGMLPTINQSNQRGLYSFHPAGVHVSMCDGSIRFLDEGIDTDTFVALLTRAGDDHAGSF